mgnify:CR=1 FL=1
MTAGAPTTRMAEAVTGAVDTGMSAATGVEAGLHWTEELFPFLKDNPWARAAKATGKSLTEARHVGNLPVTDSAVAMRVFNYAYTRAGAYVLEKDLPAAVQTFAQQVNLTPDDATRLANQLLTAGKQGGAPSMLKALDEFVATGGQKIDLRTQGVADEILSANGWRTLEQGINQAARSSPDPQTAADAIAAAINQTIDAEKTLVAYILRSATPEPGVFEWSKAAKVGAQADVADDIVQAAIASGLTPAQAQEAARRVVIILDETENQATAECLKAVQSAPPDGSAMRIVFDMLAGVYDLKRIARSQVDELSKQAVRTGTSEAWAKKFADTDAIYKKLALDLQQLIALHRDDLIKLANGEPIPSRTDWWEAIRRYVEFDAKQVEQARSLYAGSSKFTPADVFDRIIEANRKIVDASYVKLYDIFRRFPTLEGFDILRTTQRNIDMEGARAASFLAEQRELARAGKLPWDEYFAIRNATWNSVADNQVAFNEAAAKAVVSIGVGKQAPTGLKWTDQFAGGTFQLMGRKPNGNWIAMRLDDGAIHEFGSAKPDIERIMAIAGEMAAQDKSVRFGPGQSIDPTLLTAIRKYAENMTVGGDEFAGIVGDPTYLDAVKAGYSKAAARAKSALPDVPQAVIDDYTTVVAAVSKVDTDLASIRQQMDAIHQQLDLLATNGAKAGAAKSPSGATDAWLKLNHDGKVKRIFDWLVRRAQQPAPALPPPPRHNPPHTPHNP